MKGGILLNQFLIDYGTEILFSVTGVIITTLSAALIQRARQYKKLKQEMEQKRAEEWIEGKLDPIWHELEEIRAYVRKTEVLEETRIALIVSSYKFRLIQLCKGIIAKGYMTQREYDQLTEFFKLYEGLGGNGQAKEYYEKAIQCPVHD